jgi:hypothetical protein
MICFVAFVVSPIHVNETNQEFVFLFTYVASSLAEQILFRFQGSNLPEFHPSHPGSVLAISRPVADGLHPQVMRY